MRLTALTALIVFVLDQLTKVGVVWGLNLAERGGIDVIPPFLTFRMAWNRGVNFGIGAGEGDLIRWGLIVVSLVISGWVWIWVSRSNPSRLARLSGGLLIGGALGNVIDRVLYGAVADFLNMSCCGFENPYAFNVADIAIFAGAIGLVLFTGEPGGKAKTGGKAGGGKPAAARRKGDGKTP